MVERPVLRYHGGKWKLAEWIIEHMPSHRIYCEPFAGAASVLMRKPRSYGEVYNDRWSTVVNVFRVLRDEATAAELLRALELTPYARDEFVGAYAECDGPVELARRTILRSFSGFGSASTNGAHATGFRANSNRSGTTPAQDWRNYPSNIPAFVERLRGVVIENRPAVEVITQQDSPGTLFYVDPPYPHSTRNLVRGNAAYAVEMTDDDHRGLADVLRSVRGMVLLSSYHSPLYEEIYSGWTRRERATHGDGAVDRLEVLWLNDAAAKKQRQHRLMIA